MAAPTAALAIVIRDAVADAEYHSNSADYPSVFGLLRTRRGCWDCPATLIAPHWAITAAHCTEAPRIAEAMSAGAGYAVEIGGVANRIDRITRHPNAPNVDIALLHLQSASAIPPSSLYAASDEVGKHVVLLGWGDTGSGAVGVVGPDGQMRRAENVIDQADDANLSWLFDAPPDALPLEGISGPGDSGGPALIQTAHGLALAGISSGQDSMGHGRGHYGVREYYARISTARAWIEANISSY
jgi:secreted trypsin-like serine protease